MYNVQCTKYEVTKDKGQRTMNEKIENKEQLAWLWVPTLYFAEGVPYFLVNQISVAMFTTLGVANDSMAFFTSLIYLPWVIKPFWAPFVDLIKTKRIWIISMEALIAITMILTLISIPHPEPEAILTMTTPVKLFYLTLIWFVIMAFASATHDIAADGFYMLALSPKRQAEMIGWRSVFYRLSNVFCNSALVAIPGIVVTKGYQMTTGWQVTMAVAAVIYILITIWHFFTAPKPIDDRPATNTSAKEIARGFIDAFYTFFSKKGIVLALCFMLLYRLPEAFLVKMEAPFLLGSADQGGMDMPLQTYGVVYGVIGVCFLLLGGILGGRYISRVGLKRSLWWMAAAITLPDLAFVYLSVCRPTNIALIASAIAIEQMGYGFGFTAYMMYLVFFSEGEYKTTHYALCTGFMALSMMLPGMAAGKLQLMLGYRKFFVFVIACCTLTLIVTYFVRRQVDEDYGRSTK